MDGDVVKIESQVLLLTVLLPHLRGLKFRAENSKSNYWSVKRRWDDGITRSFKTTHSIEKRRSLRALKFEDSSDFKDWKKGLDEDEAAYSAFWDAMIDAGVEIPSDWNERK